MAHILDFESPADYRVTDALYELVKTSKRDAKRTDVYRGRITTPRDVVHSLSMGITEGVENSVKVILRGLPSRRSVVHSDISTRQWEDYKAVFIDPFDAHTLSSFALILYRDVAHFAGFMHELLMLENRPWNDVIWATYRAIVKAWRIIVNPRLLVGVAYAYWLEVKKIIKAVVFRNPGSNILRSWMLMGINILQVWVVEAIAFVKAVKKYLKMSEKGQSLFGWRIVVPGLEQPAKPGWIARKLRSAYRWVKNLVRRVWREIKSYSIGRLLSDIFGTGAKVTRSASYEGMWSNMRKKGYSLWAGSERYPHGYTHGGHRRQETYNRRTMASLNGRIQYP